MGSWLWHHVECLFWGQNLRLISYESKIWSRQRTEPKCPQAVTAFCIILLRERCGFILRNVTAAVLWYTYLIRLCRGNNVRSGIQKCLLITSFTWLGKWRCGKGTQLYWCTGWKRWLTCRGLILGNARSPGPEKSQGCHLKNELVMASVWVSNNLWDKL